MWGTRLFKRIGNKSNEKRAWRSQALTVYDINNVMAFERKEVMARLIALAIRKAQTGAKFMTRRTNANKTVIKLKTAIRAKKISSLSLLLCPLRS